jgi:hypothetical protein
MVMKQTYLFFLVLLMVLSSCGQLEEDTSDPAIRSYSKQILIEPCISNIIEKEGGTIVITAFYHDNDEKGNTSKRVLNDFFIDSVNFDAPYVKFKGRERVNDQKVRYTFVFEKNETGKDCEPVAAAIGDTSSFPNGFGWFKITQKGQ